MAFTYRLEKEDGTPADPPTLHTAVPTWHAGDTIPLSAERALRVVEIRSVTADENPGASRRSELSDSATPLGGLPDDRPVPAQE
jgi:hypothetical protein